MYNSTIRPKMGVCALCTDGKRKLLTKGMCQEHYWQNNRIKSAQKFAGKDLIDEEGLPELIEEADAVFSRYVRLSAADELGIIECYICENKLRWQDGQAMHFIKRMTSYYHRWDLRNVKPGCKTCNEIKEGNYLEFAKKLNADQPGITDILYEESNLVHHLTRDEVRKVIGEYSTKIKELLKQKA